jgi:nucleotide-binding universal stress UspA family protein
MWPGAESATRSLPSIDASQPGKRLRDVSLAIAPLEQHLVSVRNAGAGVIVTRMPKRSLVEAILGRGGVAADLCNQASAPVMFLQGRTSYERIVHPVLEDVLDERVAYEAIDIARLLSLKVSIVRVTLPEYIASPPEAVSRIVASLERRLRLHEVPFETLSLTGNPVRAILGLAKPNDLLVIGRRASKVDSFASPDVALRVARDTHSSVLVRTLPR